MNSITVIGSLNIDIVVRSARVPNAGETIAGTELHIIPGGKGANQAVAASKAGAPTRMIGSIGNDAFGQELTRSLSLAGVNSEGVSILQGVTTGTATILLEEAGENRIIIVPGANGQVTPQQIDALWSSVVESKMILLQMEIPLETIAYIIKKASANKIPVLLNTAPIYPLPEDLYPLIHTLVANETEAALLSGRSVTDQATALAAAKSICAKGVNACIITLGAQGAILYNQTGSLFQPSFKVKVVDTTAAGDTFVGVYAACVLAGRTTAESMKFASAAAAIAVTRLGAQTSMPAWQEVLQFLGSVGD